MKTYSLIIAGGGGTRFWPISRQRNPKQLLNLSGEDTLINETLKRSNIISKKENVVIVTNEGQGVQLEQIVADRCLHENILMEPAGRNTAAAIGYGAFYIMKKYGDGVMCVFPADHYIKDVKEFENTLKKAIDIAQKGEKLVTIGIKPTFPSTGYGYINYHKDVKYGDHAYEVEEFVEKPNFERAKSYVESGEYLWNSGMFIWKVSKILEDFKRYLPKIYKKLETLSKYIGTEDEDRMIHEIYPSIQSISIDYGIMERADDVATVPGDFGWNDVGSWDVLGSIYPTDEDGNVKRGNNITLSTRNSIIYGNSRLITTIGVENMIVVETADSILVCDKDKAQDVKKIVQKLKDEKMEEYL